MLEAGRLASSEELLSRQLPFRGWDPSLWSLLGQLRSRQMRTQEAVEAFDVAAKLGLSPAEYAVLCAEAYQEVGEYNEVLSLLRNVECSDGLALKVRALSVLGKLDEARSVLATGEILGDHLLVALPRFALAHGRSGEAIHWATLGVARNPTPKTCIELLDLLLVAGHLRLARQLAKDLDRNLRELPAFLSTATRIAIRSQDVETASREIERLLTLCSLEVHPSARAHVYELQGYVAQARGDQGKAAESLLRSYRTRPTPHTLVLWSGIRRGQGLEGFEEAKALLKAHLSASPRDPVVLQGLVVLQVAQRALSAAKQTATTGLSIKELSPEARLRLTFWLCDARVETNDLAGLDRTLAHPEMRPPDRELVRGRLALRTGDVTAARTHYRAALRAGFRSGQLGLIRANLTENELPPARRMLSEFVLLTDLTP
ncbi:MAG: hypothetical protein R3F62_26885 [Planctomycetota bacterium]